MRALLTHGESYEYGQPLTEHPGPDGRKSKLNYLPKVVR